MGGVEVCYKQQQQHDHLHATLHTLLPTAHHNNTTTPSWCGDVTTQCDPHRHAVALPSIKNKQHLSPHPSTPPSACAVCWRYAVLPTGRWFSPTQQNQPPAHAPLSVYPPPPSPPLCAAGMLTACPLALRASSARFLPQSLLTSTSGGECLAVSAFSYFVDMSQFYYESFCTS